MSVQSRKQKSKHPRRRQHIVDPPVLLGNSPSSLPPMGVKPAPVNPPPTELQPDDRVRCPNVNCGVLTKRRVCPICEGRVPQPDWRLPVDSEIREAANRILALRAGGLTPQEIGDKLGLNPSSFNMYLYRAHKNGWLEYNNAKEAIEYGLMPKALKILDRAMEDEHNRHQTTGLTVAAQVAMKVAEGVTFKEFGPDLSTGSVLPQTAISIRIEQPANPTFVRPGTIGGYLEGEKIDGE